jgi:hypothetical protein
MKPRWIGNLKHNPVEPLLVSNNPAIIYFTKRDLSSEKVGPINELRDLPEVKIILKKQVKNGSFGHISKNPLVDTWR